MSPQTTPAQLPVGQIGFGAMRITGQGIWGRTIHDFVMLNALADAPATRGAIAQAVGALKTALG